MKAKIVLAGVLVSMMVVEVSAQRAEFDDMYFRGKDREKNKAIAVEESLYASAKKTKETKEEVAAQEEDNSNPTDSYSARNVNPEYVSRSNSEKASEDESNYYLEGYTPPASATTNFNNSYYNNISPSSNSYYANNNPYYGGCACGSMSPYYGAGYYNPWMSPAYGYGGFSSGLSISLMYGNYANPYGGYGMYNPYYGYGNPYYGGYGYSPYYGNSSYYYESAKQVNYGKRPSRNSAAIQPTQRIERNRNTTAAQNVANVNSGTQNRQRQTQDDYYVRPSRRSSSFGQTGQLNSLTNDGGSWITPNAQQSQSRTRDSYSPSHTSSPSYTPSYSPGSSSRGSSGSSGGGGGSSSPRPRGRN